MDGLKFIFGYMSKEDTDRDGVRKQVLRIALTHSKASLNIHPHHYYYWIDALILTAQTLDHKWHKDLEYYWREVLFRPISFIISQYYREEGKSNIE